MLRNTQQINISLSQMADQKASILMGATFVVFTISVAQAAKGVNFTIIVLALFSFISAMLAVFAVLPSVKKKSKRRGVRNILFFGSFTEMTEDEFANAVLEKLKTDESVYRLMLEDIYQNGQVLHRKKYKYLSYAYIMFLTGLCLTIVVFLVEQFR